MQLSVSHPIAFRFIFVQGRYKINENGNRSEFEKFTETASVIHKSREVYDPS